MHHITKSLSVKNDMIRRKHQQKRVCAISHSLQCSHSDSRGRISTHRFKNHAIGCLPHLPQLLSDHETVSIVTDNQRSTQIGHSGQTQHCFLQQSLWPQFSRN